MWVNSSVYSWAGERLEDKVALLMKHTISESALYTIGAELITHLFLHAYKVDIAMFVHTYTVQTSAWAHPGTQKQDSHTRYTNTHAEANEFKCAGHEFLTANTADKPTELG